MQVEMLFISGHFQTSRISNYNASIIKVVGEIINDYIIKHTRFTVFPLYFQVITIYFIIENSFGNINFRRFLLHRNKQGSQLGLSLRTYDVLEIKGYTTNGKDENNKRAHDFK